MKRQLIHIHGGESWGSYNEYIEYLRTYEIADPNKPTKQKWRKQYAELLQGDWLFMLPEMPSARNAKYEEWKIWFEKYFPYMHDGIVCVGSSLGASFLAKYLSENTMPVRVGQLHLVAGRFFTRDESFRIDAELLAKNVELQCDKIFLYHSKDDFVVPFEDVHKFNVALPAAELVVFEDRGHFLQPSFPELLANITAH